MNNLFLFNTTIAPNEGLFLNRKITAKQAQEIYANAMVITSAIGHQGTAEAFTALDMPCGVNRINAQMAPGDKAICLKVLGRVAEGQILDLETLNEVGYQLYLLTNLGCNIDTEGDAYHSRLGWLTPEDVYTHGS